MKHAAALFIRLFGALLAVFLAVTGALMWASFSPTLHQLLLETVSEEIPEAQFNHVQGSLAGGLQFDFSYSDEAVSVALTGAHLQIKPRCFLQFELCVRSIQVERINVTVNDAIETDEASDKVVLPQVVIPIPVSIDLVSVGELNVLMASDPLYYASDIQFSASGINHRINILNLNARDGYCSWQGSGMIRLTRRYPMDVHVACDTAQYPLSKLIAHAQGDLDHLSIQAQTDGQLASQLNITLQPLFETLPVDFALKLTKPFMHDIDDNRITALEASVAGKGDLDGLTLTLSGKLGSPLFPSPLQLSSSSLLTTERLQLDDLIITLPEGKLRSHGELLFEPEFTWKAVTDLNKVNLHPFEDSIQGEINGTIHHNGQLSGNSVSINASLDQLNGILHNTPWEMNGDVALIEEQLQVNNVEILQDRNHVKANGTLNLNGKSNLQLSINIKQFDLIAPKLAGSVKGELMLSDTLEQPTIKGNLQAHKIAYDDITLSSAQAIVNIQPLIDEHNQLQLRFDDLRIADEVILDGLATIEGNAKHHIASIRIQDKQANQFSVQCHGKFPLSATTIDTDLWQAQCSRSAVQPTYLQPAQTWQLQKPFTLELKNLDQVTISPLCYTHLESTLCSQKTVRANADEVNPILIAGSNLDLAWLRPWLPSDANLHGTAEFDATIQLLPNLSIQASAASENSQLVLFDNTAQSMALDISHAELSANLAQDTLAFKWQLQSSIGNSNGKLRLQDQQLSGDVLVDNFIVSPFSHWLLVDEGDHLQGTLSGDFKLGGSLKSPELAGKARLAQGEIHTAMLPLPITDISINLTTEQRIAYLEGRFLVGNKPGQLKGTFNWQQEDWWSKVSFQSETLAYQPEENILVYLKPDIAFNLTPTSLTINGDVHIPKARIHLKSLPEQAVTASPDTVIVGNETESGAGLQISSNLILTLGDDVRFKGYGLETDVTGQMTISQHRSDLLQSKGIIRLKNGTYQAYGQSLDITDGDLIFIDDLENPQLRLSATRNNISDNVVVGIRVTGRARNPEIAIFSIPEMPQQEKFYYLITGRAPNTDSTQDSSSVAAEAAVAMALEARSGALTRKAGETLGIQDLTLSTGSTENRSEVGLSGYITPDLMIRYGVGMFEAVNTLTLKYRIRKNLYAEVISGKSNAFDLLWSFDRD